MCNEYQATDHWIKESIKTDIQFWAVLGSRGCREKNYELKIGCALDSKNLIWLWDFHNLKNDLSTDKTGKKIIEIYTANVLTIKTGNCGRPAWKICLQFLQPFSIDSADFPCRSPAISSPCSFYGQNICSVLLNSCPVERTVDVLGFSFYGWYVDFNIF